MRRSSRRSSCLPLANTCSTTSSASSPSASAFSRMNSLSSSSLNSITAWSATNSTASSRAIERADEARQELGCARLDERTGGLDVGGHHEGIDGSGAELCLHFFRDLLAETLLDVGA